MTYTEDTAPATIDLDAPRDNPNAITYTLQNVPDQFTFTNTGEQQCVILYIEYHFGGDITGISASNEGTPVRVEYFTLAGERIETPRQGMYVVRITTASGKTFSRKMVVR